MAPDSLEERAAQLSLPGAAPEAEPIGRGRRQNARLAKDTRLAQAELKRAQRKAKARMGRPRKTRTDKGRSEGRIRRSSKRLTR